VSDWQRDLSASSRAFLGVVWPIIQNKCGGGDIKPVEVLQDNQIARDLDVLCGIDVWQTIGGHGARGIASRVQPDKRNWGTFTIRRRRFNGAQTEYEKRLAAIRSGGRFIYPYLTCHAYVDGPTALGIGLARTIDVFETIEAAKEAGPIPERFCRDAPVFVKSTNNADFFVVWFWAVKDCWIYPKEPRRRP
jgi:hypothetical protein